MQSFFEDIDAWDVVENKVLKSANVQKTNWAKKKERLISHISKDGIICFWEDHAYWKCKGNLGYFRQNLQRLQDKKKVKLLTLSIEFDLLQNKNNKTIEDYFSRI